MKEMKDFYDSSTGTFMFEPNSKEFWKKVLDDKKTKKIITGRVIALNYNGLVVDYNGFRAFMPSKNISSNKVDSYEKYLNSDLDFIITEIIPAKEKIVVSHKDIEIIQKKEELKKRFQSITPGHIYSGKVISIKDFGAFIEIEPDIVGLVHLSQISHNRIKSPNQVLSVKQEVKVKVLSNENDRISLSIKALEKPQTNETQAQENEGDFKAYKKNTKIESASTSLADLLNNIEL